jgi:hypothetical protein
LYFLDANEFLRAMAGAPRPGVTGRASGFYTRPTGSAPQALVTADVVAFLRLGPPVTAALAWLVVCLIVLLVDPGLPAPVQLAAVVLAVCATASGMGAVARRTALVPELDALLPLAPTLIRASRMFMPALTLTLWMAALTGLLVFMEVGGPALILLGALSGAGMGAGVIRGAGRPAADWSAPLVETPFGAVPSAQVASLVRGIDVTLLAITPLIFALYFGSLHPGLFLLQVLISASAVLTVILLPSQNGVGQKA